MQIQRLRFSGIRLGCIIDGFEWRIVFNVIFVYHQRIDTQRGYACVQLWNYLVDKRSKFRIFLNKIGNASAVIEGATT